METQQILDDVREIAHKFAERRAERQRRRELDPRDFERISETGYLRLAVPVDQGGAWQSLQRSTRPVCEALRALAHGDSSVALVSAMHPVVLALWLANPEAPRPHRRAWEEQRRRVFQSAHDGAWWGTMTSESGSGGDITQSSSLARLNGDKTGYLLSGCKHFGTGLGIVSYMITAAIPAGEVKPDWFFMHLDGVPWDGSAGAKLLAEWDGHGMIATHSHSMLFEAFPVERFAWPGNLLSLAHARDGFEACAFTAVIVGIVEAAVETARDQLRPFRGSLDAYRKVEWSKVEMEAWLIQQAYAGMLRAMETQESPRRVAVQGKLAVAELAESVLRRIVRVVGGGTYARRSPFGFWFEDVRALGFLRPPWGLTFEQLFDLGWE